MGPIYQYPPCGVLEELKNNNGKNTQGMNGERKMTTTKSLIEFSILNTQGLKQDCDPAAFISNGFQPPERDELQHTLAESTSHSSVILCVGANNLKAALPSNP